MRGREPGERGAGVRGEPDEAGDAEGGHGAGGTVRMADVPDGDRHGLDGMEETGGALLRDTIDMIDTIE